MGFLFAIAIYSPNRGSFGAVCEYISKAIQLMLAILYRFGAGALPHGWPSVGFLFAIAIYSPDDGSFGTVRDYVAEAIQLMLTILYRFRAGAFCP